MINGIQFSGSMRRFMAGSGIEAVESRVKQLEGMINAIENRGANKPFAAYLDGMTPPAAASKTVTGSIVQRKAQLAPLIEKFAQQYNIDKKLVHAVIRQESGYNPAAVSHAGAMGLMQLMPATAKSLGVTNPMDPAQNLEGGVRHLKNLLIHYHGNVPLALAAYNAGMGAVKKYDGIPPYKETQNYVRSILAMYLSEKNLRNKSEQA